jgi:hypothetical protein
MGLSYINTSFMGKTFRHTIVAKFKNGLLSAKDALINIKKMWYRHNWDIGEFRAKKKQIVEKIIDNLNKKS